MGLSGVTTAKPGVAKVLQAGRSRVEQATQARGVIDGVIIGASRGGVRRSTGIDGGASSEQTSMVVLGGARGGAQR
jgi:hypothetical protein